MAVRDPIRDHYLETRLFQARAITAAAISAALVLTLLGRLYYLQQVNHSHYETLSTNNRVRLMAVAPSRGLIFDRNGVLIAENLPNYRVEITPEEVPDIDQTLAELSRLISFDEDDLERFRAASRRKLPFEGIPLRANLDDESVARIASNRHRFPGVDIVARLSRHYPLGELTSHSLGYVARIDEQDLVKLDATDYSGTSHIGKTGIEKRYEGLLHGTVGFRQVEVNAQGRVLRILEEEPAVPGINLHLTLDMELHRIAAEAFGVNSGALAAIDPRNGDVLVLLSQPGFDTNLFVNGISARVYNQLRDAEDQPLFNRALSGQYPPGSIVKPFLGLAALEHGVQLATQSTFCGGYFRLPNDTRRYRDWKKYGHGVVDLNDAITQSCDVFFYDIALRLGIDRMSPYLAHFGFGQRTGIDNVGESAGILPSREWKREHRQEIWFPGETLITGIGQGYLSATPLQMAVATATLANRGTRIQPRLLASVNEPPAPDAQREPQVLSRLSFDDMENWSLVIHAMENVTQHERGTAYAANRTATYRIAGKTGTAQVVGIAQDEEYDEEKIARKLRDHAVYVAFAPVESPAIAVAVIVEHGGSGGRVASPIGREVMDAYLVDRLQVSETRN